jgi:hypothetical protein
VSFVGCVVERSQQPHSSSSSYRCVYEKVGPSRYIFGRSCPIIRTGEESNNRERRRVKKGGMFGGM